MQPELKQKWIEALRSGKYKQGVGVLRSATDKFCCLGVLCDITDNNSWKLNSYAGYYYFKDRGYYLYGSLNYDQVKDFGLYTRQISELVKMNDTGSTFQEISEYIEKNL